MRVSKVNAAIHLEGGALSPPFRRGCGILPEIVGWKLALLYDGA